MARFVYLNEQDCEELKSGAQIQKGPVRIMASGDCFPQLPGPVEIMLDEHILARLLLGGTQTIGRVTLDWNEDFDPDKRDALVALMGKRGPAAKPDTA